MPSRVLGAQAAPSPDVSGRPSALGQCCPGIWEDACSHSPEVALSGTRAGLPPKPSPSSQQLSTRPGSCSSGAGLLAPGHAGGF